MPFGFTGSRQNSCLSVGIGERHWTPTVLTSSLMLGRLLSVIEALTKLPVLYHMELYSGY